MNKSVISAPELLKTAKEIVFQEGMNQLSIRYLAQKSGVSVGTIYNYFPSKSSLMIAVVEDFWREFFYKDICTLPQDISFPDFLEKLYLALLVNLTNFKSTFLSFMAALEGQDMDLGREKMQEYFHHIIEGLEKVLEADKNIPSRVWSSDFTRKQFASFAFSHMRILLETGSDFQFFKEMIIRVIYPR